jgi:hypothetical protein
MTDSGSAQEDQRDQDHG